jgi:hypothetical protein
MLERGETLAKFPPPKLDAALAASAMRGLVAVLILAGGVALVSGWLKGRERADSASRKPKDAAERPAQEPS